jgi:uncharacterized protein YutE (UPF0331/DUF86 family)
VNNEEAERLIRHVRFLEEELGDYSRFRKLTWPEYSTHRTARRNAERWIENLVNSTIDIARLVLGAEGRPIPGTYREIVAMLGLVAGFPRESTVSLSNWVSLRNVLSHEYLDVKWAAIKRFIGEAEPMYQDLLKSTKTYLGRNLHAAGQDRG